MITFLRLLTSANTATTVKSATENPTKPFESSRTGKRDAHNEDLVMDCVKLLKKEGVYVVPDPETAIVLLKKLQRREKITSDIPEMISATYKEMTGQTLVLR